MAGRPTDRARASKGAFDEVEDIVSAKGRIGRLPLTEVEDKSNEITAIPKLLELMDLKCAVVTIDASAIKMIPDLTPKSHLLTATDAQASDCLCAACAT
jgi:hypothetical protein